MWLAPKVILSNQVDNKILVIITKPSKMLERTLAITCFCESDIRVMRVWMNFYKSLEASSIKTPTLMPSCTTPSTFTMLLCDALLQNCQMDLTYM